MALSIIQFIIIVVALAVGVYAYVPYKNSAMNIPVNMPLAMPSASSSPSLKTTPEPINTPMNQSMMYGPVDRALERVTKKPFGIKISPNAGAHIGVLGTKFSAETDGERKHLHLGIHKGKDIVLLGYVQAPQELDQWIDVMALLK